MKTIFSIFMVAAIAVHLFAEETNSASVSKFNAPLKKIGAAEATNYYDREMIVTGKVAQVTIRPTVTFLNLDKPFPRSPFTIVIFHGHSNFYGDANALKEKQIEIKGKIKKYGGKPEIALDNTNQLTVWGATNLNIFARPPATTQPPAVPSTNFPEIM